MTHTLKVSASITRGLWALRQAVAAVQQNQKMMMMQQQQLQLAVAKLQQLQAGAQPQAQQGGDSQRQAAPQEQAGAGGVSDTRTVVNHVNLDKRSVRVYRRGSRVRVAFAFDATRPCEVSVLWLAREDADAACATQTAASFRRAFPGALGQRFGDGGRGGGR